MFLAKIALFTFALTSVYSWQRPRARTIGSRSRVSWSNPLIQNTKSEPQLIHNRSCDVTDDEDQIDDRKDMESLENELQFLRNLLEAQQQEYDNLLHAFKVSEAELKRENRELISEIESLTGENANLRDSNNAAEQMIRTLSRENYLLSK